MPIIIVVLPVTLLMLFVAEAVQVDPLIPDGHQLNHALHHFEVLHKDHLRHSHVERNSRRVHFSTLDRDFQLLLATKKDPLRDKLQVHVIGERGSRESFGINSNHFFIGRLADDPHSSVHAHLDHSQGILSASIRTSSDHYYIEPSHPHFTQPHDFHMVSYRASDLKYNLTEDPSQHFCGVSDDHHSYPGDRSHTGKDGASFGKHNINKQAMSNDDLSTLSDRERLKRQTGFDPDKVLCPLDIVATHKFHALYSTAGSVQNSILYLVNLIDIVDEEVFRRTQWSDDIISWGFSVHNITIFTNETADPEYNSAKSWNSPELLNSFSQHDWSDVCLAHLFTAEAFTDGNLGVAFIANSDLRASGGICSQRLVNFNGVPVTTQNVGVSSLQRGSRALLLAEAKLITAHELGHNWGSDHDPTAFTGPCNPPLDSGGKFLMFPSVSSGDQSNNNDFSVCSRMMVSDAIRSKNFRCFIENVPNTCGDYVVNGTEACDAGFAGMLGSDPCCDSSCQLKTDKECSDVNSECCSGCMFASNTTVCRSYSANTGTCLRNVTCTGVNDVCPLEDLEDVNQYLPVETMCQGSGRCLPNTTLCNSSGSCDLSLTSPSDPLKCFNLCEQQDMVQCFCPAFSPDECSVCCRDQSENSTCSPLTPTVLLSDGSTCLGGTCRSGTCVPATQDLASRLFTLFTDISIDKFFEFMSENIVASVLFCTTVLWVPISIIIYCVDRKRWNKFSEEADEQEEKVHLLNMEDEFDLNQIDTIAQTHPDIDTHQAKKALTRQVSITDSIYDGSFMFGGTYYLPSSAATPSPGWSSPSKGLDDHRRKLSAILEESQNLDPERHNIQQFVGSRRTSATTERRVEFKDQSSYNVDKGQKSSAITGQSTPV